MEELLQIIHKLTDKELAALEEQIRREWIARFEQELFRFDN